MKVENITTNGNGRTVIRFALGKDEAELILGSVRATYKYFPITFERSQDRTRLRNIIHAIGKAFPELIQKPSQAIGTVRENKQTKEVSV